MTVPRGVVEFVEAHTLLIAAAVSGVTTVGIAARIARRIHRRKARSR